MLEQIFRRAAARSLAIAQVETRLVLDGPIRRDMRREHRRVVRPALPEWSYSTLLKLIQLDLELHPPEAAVIALHLVAQPARSQSVQQGLFTPQTPEAGRLEILLARLRKLVGEERVGAAELLDNHRPDAFRMAAFVPGTGTASRAVVGPCPSALRILRPPRVIRVEVSEQGSCPQRLKPDSQQCAYRSGEPLRHPKASSTSSFPQALMLCPHKAYPETNLDRIWLRFFWKGKSLWCRKTRGPGRHVEHGGLIRIGRGKSGTWHSVERTRNAAASLMTRPQIAGI